MITHRSKALLVALVVLLSMFALTGTAFAKNKDEHHNGQQLLGKDIKNDGHHDIHHKGDYTSSVETKNGKIAGFHVHHATKGDIPVKKYKTHKNMSAAGINFFAPFLVDQNQDLGTVWIGFSYTDSYGNVTIYWFPYDMVLDGDTGAVEYIAE